MKVILIALTLLFLFFFLKEVNIYCFLEKIILKIKEKTWEKRYLASLKKKSKNLVSFVNRLGDFYISKGRYKDALNIYEKAYSLIEKGKIKNNIIWNIFNGLALLAEKKGDFDLAIEYVKRGEIIRGYFNFQESSDYLEKNCFMLSKWFFKKGDKKKALKYLDGYFSDEVRKNITEAEILLNFFNYKKAKKLLKRLEKDFSDKEEGIEIDYLLCIALLGEKSYAAILKISQKPNFFKSANDNLAFVLYSSFVAYIKAKKYKEAKERLDIIYNIIIYHLGSEDFYKFYYYNFLLYYGLGCLNFSQKKYTEAKNNYKKILEIIEIIPEVRLKYMMERVNIYFFKLLANFEIIKMEKNITIKKQKIKVIKDFSSNLTSEEKNLIKLIEIGNEGSIINKINNLK
ncbi:MAG: tetratricopeptide repeat protein [Clostridia bacterium]|nr:tetratricopeptide repeat protein [Clostridia bacterium]